MTIKRSQVFSGVAALFTILINALANFLPLNNLTTAMVSDSFETYFVPAGFTFLIWSVIYLGFLVFVIGQTLLDSKRNELIENITPWFLLSCVANSMWIFAWHYGYFLTSLSLALVLWYSLLVIFLKLEKSTNKTPFTQKEYAILALPFHIYFGWASVALIANTSHVLWYVGWNGSPLAPQMWAGIMIIVASIVGSLMILRHKAFSFALVIAWAILGIVSKFTQEGAITGASAVAYALLISSTGYVLYQSRKSKSST